MSWPTAPTAAKYRTREHRETRAAAIAELRRAGSVTCAHAPLGECVMADQSIYPDDVGDRAPHLCHDPTGQTYIGLGHAKCNRDDGARRGNARSHGQPDPTATPSRRWVL